MDRKARRAALRQLPAAEVLPWMERTGHGRVVAARIKAAELLAPHGVEPTEDDVKYLSGRINRWQVAAKKRGHTGVDGQSGRPSEAERLRQALAPRYHGGVGRQFAPPSQTTSFDEGAGVAGSIADLAVDGSLEEYLEASMRQVEDNIARRMAKGLDITHLKKLGANLRTQLEELRVPPEPDIEDMDADQRQELLEREVPSWPDFVLQACADELARRRGRG